MGNQQMAFSSNPQPPSVEDPNEWYDSVSDVDDHKQPINPPENNVVVNGILDEFIDSLFESKLSNTPSDVLTSQCLPEDQRCKNTDQIRPTTYGEVVPNLKGVAVSPEPDSPEPPNKLHLPPSRTENKTSTKNPLQNKTKESPRKDNNLCKEDGLLLTKQQKADEGPDSIKELCPKSDSTVPLPCPEDLEMLRKTTVSENIKAFELTPKDVQAISQPGKFCEVLCDSKEKGLFQSPLETKEKCSNDNFDDDVPSNPEGMLGASKVISANEEALQQTTSHLESFDCNRRQDSKGEKANDRPITYSDTHDISKLDQLSVNLAIMRNISPNETIQQSNKKQIHQDFKSNILDPFGVNLPEMMKIAPCNKAYNYPEAPLEHVMSINKNLDDTPLLPIVDVAHSQNSKFSQEIQKSIISEGPDYDVTRKEQTAICTSEFTSVDTAGGQDGLSNCIVDAISVISPTDAGQDSTISKANRQDYNLCELDVASENLETNLNSVEIQDPNVKEHNVLKPMLNVDSSANKIVTVSSSATTDVRYTVVTEEMVQDPICSPSKSSADNIEIKSSLSETENPVVVTSADNFKDIPPISEIYNDSASSLGDKTLPPYNCEMNTSLLSKHPDTVNKPLAGTEMSKSVANESANNFQNEEIERKSIGINSSITENLNVSPTSVPIILQSNNIETLINTKHTPFKPLVDILSVETESHSPETGKPCDDNVNSATHIDEYLGALAALVGVDKMESSHNSNAISVAHQKDADISSRSLEEAVKFKSLENETASHYQNGGSSGFSDVYSEKEINKSVTENVNLSSAAIINETTFKNEHKETPRNIMHTPRKSSLGILSSKTKALSPETEKHVKVKRSDNINSIDESSKAFTPLLERNKVLSTQPRVPDIKNQNVNDLSFCLVGREDNPPSLYSQNYTKEQNAENIVPKYFVDSCGIMVGNEGESVGSQQQNGPEKECSHSNSADRIIDGDAFSTPVEEKQKLQSFGKEQTEYSQHEETKRTTETCSQVEKLENISASIELIKETDGSVGATILHQTKQYRNLYEEGNICDLDEVINQFRQKHNSEKPESYFKQEKRKSLLDKSNAKKCISDKRRNSGKYMEKNDFQPASECTKETIVSDIKNQQVSDIKNTKEQNSENILPKDFVNFCGVMVGNEGGSIGCEHPNDSKKVCADIATEKETMDSTNNSSMNVNIKKERMPELKPETLMSLIADLSLNKSTMDAGCNTVEDWTKKDFSNAEADWLKEKKKLIGRITDLHQTQNATKFIVKELIFLVTSWMEGKDKDNVDLQETRQKLMNERDQALEDLRSVEESFYELHRRYEKTKKLIEDYKKNEEILKRQISEGEEILQQQKQMFDYLVKHSEEKLEKANAEILNMGKCKESQMAVLTAQLRKAEMKANSLEKALEQKVRENTELSSICEELISKCGKK